MARTADIPTIHSFHKGFPPRAPPSPTTATRVKITTESHLAIALGVAATEAGYRTYFTAAADMVAALQAAHLEGTATYKLRTYLSPSVLVIDELGCAPRGAGGSCG
jgi:hypothetical protein